MLVAKLLGIICLVTAGLGTPLSRPENAGNEGSRLSTERRHHHHRPTNHDGVDSEWDYQPDVGLEIIDLTGVDPCENVVCQPHTLCVVQRRNQALCINKKDIFRYSGINSSPNHCVSCEEEKNEIPVCGSNGQTFTSGCVLRYHACLKNVDLQVICAGECPCPIDLIAHSAISDDMAIGDVTNLLGPPQDLSATSLEDDRTSARVVVTWNPPKGFESGLGGKAITDYIIHYSAEGEAEWESARTPGAVTSISITGLKSDTLHYFRIQARTATAIGPLSDAIFHRTIHVHSDEAETFDGEEGDIVDDQDASGDHDFEDDREA